MGKSINLEGKQFGLWTVRRKSANNKNSKTQWQCVCECGTVKNITTNSLLTYNSTSCGCNSMLDLTGKMFGDLFVISSDFSSGRRAWFCKCSCGKTLVSTSGDLRSKKIASCSGSVLCKSSFYFERHCDSEDM